MNHRYIPPWPSLKVLAGRLALMVVATCLVGSVGDMYWDWISDMRAETQAFWEQRQRSEERIAWLSTPEGREAYKQQLDAEDQALLRENTMLDPEYMADHLPCVQWPSDLQSLCAEVGGDTTWTPPPPEPTKAVTPAEEACKGLSRADTIACYARYDE